MTSGLYLGYRTLGGRVLGYGLAGDALDRVNQLISEVVDIIFSCSMPALTLKATVL